MRRDLSKNNKMWPLYSNLSVRFPWSQFWLYKWLIEFDFINDFDLDFAPFFKKCFWFWFCQWFWIWFSLMSLEYFWFSEILDPLLSLTIIFVGSRNCVNWYNSTRSVQKQQNMATLQHFVGKISMIPNLIL